MRKLLLLLCLPLWLAACGTAEPIWAPDEVVSRSVVPNDGPTRITLVTVVSNRDDAGAHSGLLIDASQRVLFDPAGTFKHPLMPERNDVHYGVTDLRRDIYLDYHARETHRVVLQSVEVSPAVAELVLRKVQDYGAVPKAQCARSISSILSGVPGFEAVKGTWFPNALSESFANVPGATHQVLRDEDIHTEGYATYIKPPADE